MLESTSYQKRQTDTNKNKNNNNIFVASLPERTHSQIAQARGPHTEFTAVWCWCVCEKLKKKIFKIKYEKKTPPPLPLAPQIKKNEAKIM